MYVSTVVAELDTAVVHAVSWVGVGVRVGVDVGVGVGLKLEVGLKVVVLIWRV
jgi:hypothetical protein